MQKKYTWFPKVWLYLLLVTSVPQNLVLMGFTRQNKTKRATTVCRQGLGELAEVLDLFPT